MDYGTGFDNHIYVNRDSVQPRAGSAVLSPVAPAAKCSQKRFLYDFGGIGAAETQTQCQAKQVVLRGGCKSSERVSVASRRPFHPIVSRRMVATHRFNCS